MLRHASSGSVPFELSLVNLLDDPTVAGFVVSAHDITARLTAELEVRETLSLLTATLESTADGILVVDASGTITSFNMHFAEMWRMPSSVVAGRQHEEALSLALRQVRDPEAFEARVVELYANPEAESYDTFEFLDGRVFERYSRPQRVDGSIVGRVWSFRDVTDARRTEADLRESEQRFRQVFNQGPLGIALVDLDSRITNTNRALCRFLRRARNELVGSSFEPVTHPDDVGKDRELARQMADGLIPGYRTETRFVTGHGDVVFGNVTASLIRGEMGRPIYGLRIIEDITERKRLEHELASHAATAGKLLASLTPREIEVLELLVEAVTTSKIAEHLSVSVRTVETHLANAYRKLGVRTREDAAAEFTALREAVAGLPKVF